MASTKNSTLNTNGTGSKRRKRAPDPKTDTPVSPTHLPDLGDTVLDGSLSVTDTALQGPPQANVTTAPQRQEGHWVVAAPPSWHGDYLFKTVKVMLDFALALTILIVSAPFILIGMLLIKLTSRGPALYKQVRVGLNGQPFTIYKLRTMRHECESLTGAKWSTPGDTRITPVGRFLRQTHLDELPQLWNVLRGEMSLVGPRPERPEFVPQLERAIPLYRSRLKVRPGLTGLAQVQLPPDTNLESVRLKLAYDIRYVHSCSLWLDFRLLVATALKVVGVPFAVIRRLVGLPRQETIQQNYHQLAAQELAKPSAQAQLA